MFNFRNNIKLCICYLITLIILISLGTWQVYRLNYKNNIIRKLELRINNKSFYPKSLNELDLEEYEYRPIKLIGHFLNDKEIHLYGGSRTLKGKPGYFILTPFKTIDNQYILINRGWIPEHEKNNISKRRSSTDKEIEIEGNIIRGEVKKYMIPNNNIEKNIWLWIDLLEAKNFTGLSLVDFFLLQKENKDEDNMIRKDLDINVRNDHLGYAMTWYLFAIISTVIFLLKIKNNKI